MEKLSTFAAMWKNNILEAIGNTPLIRLNNIVKDIPATISESGNI